MRAITTCAALLLLAAGCSSLDFGKFREADGGDGGDAAVDSATGDAMRDGSDGDDAMVTDTGVVDTSVPVETCNGTDDDGDGYVDETTLTDTLCTDSAQACVAGSCGDAPLDIELGSFHSCVRMTSGRVICWGDSLRGQGGVLDDGASSPTLITLADGTPFLAGAIAAGSTHSCGLTSGRQLYCWGDNGMGAVTDTATIPVRTQYATPSTDSLGDEIQASRLALGNDFTLAAAMTTLFAAGQNAEGQLGALDGNADMGARGRLGFTMDSMDGVAAGDAHGCAITSGSVICWGRNLDRQTGATDEVTPHVVGPDFRMVTAGGIHTCAIKSTDDLVHCWGDNEFGQLGRMSGDTGTPYPVDTLGPATSISGGALHTCALDEEGTVRCWGNNGAGQLGLSASPMELVPQTVPIAEPVLDVSAGYAHTCAITASRQVLCWGSNVSNQSGPTSPGEMEINPPQTVDVSGL